MPSIVDVATLAGVSKSTVSKVLNNYPNLKPDTIKRVNNAISELGYVPNATASSLSKKNYRKVGIILKVNDMIQTIDEIDMQYLLGVESAAAELNVETSVIFGSLLENKSLEETVAILRSKSITCLVIIGLSKDEKVLIELINQQIFPTVVAEAGIINPMTSCVSTDNKLAQYQVAKQVIDKYDCKNVLYLQGKENGYISEERFAGIKKLEEELAIEVDYKIADFSEQKSYQIVKNSTKHYDVIICASDLMAIGAKRALIAKGEFTHLVGFDGIKLLAYVGEDIPTVKQNFYQMAVECVYHAIAMQNGESSRSITVPYQITCMINENI